MEPLTLAKFATLMFLAFVATEGVVEYLAGRLFEKIEKLKPYDWLLMYLSAAVGIALAFWYRLDILALWLGEVYSPVGVVITGVLVGRGANTINTVAKLIVGWIKAKI